MTDDDIALAAHDLTTRLVDCLLEITRAAERDPRLDVLADDGRGAWDVMWLDELPAAVLDAGSEEEFVRVSPPVSPAQPPPPPDLQEWLDPAGEWPHDGDEPTLLRVRGLLPSSPPSGDSDNAVGAGSVATPPEVVSRFDRWLLTWRAWAEERRRAEEARPFYDFLEAAAKTLEQKDDEYEFVLARCLVRWIGPDGRTIRRHVVTEPMLPTLERGSAAAVVTGIGLHARFEDGDLFRHMEAYDSERAADAREAVGADLRAGKPFDEYASGLSAWLNRTILVEVSLGGSGSHAREPGSRLEITESPALVLRPRPKAVLTEAYRRIRRDLDRPEVGVPVALAQLIMDTEADQRQRWIQAQGGMAGDVLGADPRFPLDANPGQERVMDLLRTETTVVVQGPPGTGKTHTIANLMSALLARGQRVLVTSQKEQALRVLRDKVPSELRSLCVLLAGGSKDSAKELQQSLEALSDAVAASDMTALSRRARTLADERLARRSLAAKLNREIRDLREVENRRYVDVTPWSELGLYSGSLAEIVRQVKAQEETSGWLPRPLGDIGAGSPPLTNDEACELHSLLGEESMERRARLRQWIPQKLDLPTLGELVDLIEKRDRAQVQMNATETPVSRRLAGATPEFLRQLDLLGSEVLRLLGGLGYDETGAAQNVSDWIDRALGDGLAGRRLGLWRTVGALDGEAARLLQLLQEEGISYKVDLAPVEAGGLGAARGEIAAGAAYVEYLRTGGKVRRLRPSAAQRRAAPFLQRVKVNGETPEDADSCAAALRRLEAEVATVQLIEKWADCGVVVPLTRLHSTLSDLADLNAHLTKVSEVLQRHERIVAILEPLELGSAVITTPGLLGTLRQVAAATHRMGFEQATAGLELLVGRVREITTRHDACPELATVSAALHRRDAAQYERALMSLEVAAAEKEQAKRLQQLSERLATRHPRLLTLLTDTVSDGRWPERLTAFDSAWAWAAAQRFVTEQRTSERERELTSDYMRNEDQIQRVTASLAATEAMIECLDRLTDTHVRALRTFREQMQHIGVGYGKNVRRHREAARAAMEKAKSAVPAWVVPLSTLLETIPVEHNSFDVVIVDEASQVGMEQLFLLWLAPRVIVVGDDKQCTPGDGRLGGHDRIHGSIDRHLRDVESDIRMNFTPKSNLYGLLSARSGKDAVIRLREHFRCVPEIIGWSSTQFYGDGGTPGLIALRERSAGDLEPLVVRHVPDAYTEGRQAKLRNPLEAKVIADEIAACIADPRYTGKTFGVVVLQGRGQVQLLEHEIAARIRPEERTERKIRVGLPSDFQGDERNVIFLSMVVTADARRPRAQRALGYQQSFNVAASRAEDQLWLVTSVRAEDLMSDDLRASLLGYMLNPPSIYGSSPDFDAVSEDEPTSPFESLLEQRVFREIRRRGFHVIPQYPVGSRRLDLVVVGGGARIAVECDGHRYHTSAEQTDSDARRDRELHRMKWEVIRIRESEFELDREREMAKVWPALEARSIRAEAGTREGSNGWTPVLLSDEEEPQDGADE